MSRHLDFGNLSDVADMVLIYKIVIFKVEIYIDEMYLRESADNKYKYDFDYFNDLDKDSISSKCGIRVLKDEKVYRSAILLAGGSDKLLYIKMLLFSMGKISLLSLETVYLV